MGFSRTIVIGMDDESYSIQSYPFLIEMCYLCYVSEIWDTVSEKSFPNSEWKDLVAVFFHKIPDSLRTTYVLYTLEQAIYYRGEQRWQYWIRFFQDIGWLGYIQKNKSEQSINLNSNNHNILSIPRTYISSQSLIISLTLSSNLRTILTDLTPVPNEILGKIITELRYIQEHPSREEYKKWMDIQEIFRFYLKHKPETDRIYHTLFLHAISSITTQEKRLISTPVVAYALYALFFHKDVLWNSEYIYTSISTPSLGYIICSTNFESKGQIPPCYDNTCQIIRSTLHDWENTEEMLKIKGKVPILYDTWCRMLFRFCYLLLLWFEPCAVKEDSLLQFHPWIERLTNLTWDLSDKHKECADITFRTAYLYHITRTLHTYITNLCDDTLEYVNLWKAFLPWTAIPELNSIHVIDSKHVVLSMELKRKLSFHRKIKSPLSSSPHSQSPRFRGITESSNSSTSLSKAIEHTYEEYKQFAITSWWMKEIIKA